MAEPAGRPEPDPVSGDDDRWVGSDRVVQVRPHIWRWLSPRLAAGPVLEMGPGLRPTVPASRGTFVEVSPHAREVLTRRGGRALPPEELPSLPSGAFSAVLAFEVLEHIEDDVGVVSEVARLLRPGGHLVLSVPIRQSRWTALDEACGHVRRYEPRELGALLERHGLRVMGTRSTFGPPRRLANFRARMMRDHPQGSTSVVQGLLFPMHARMQRLFAAPRWRQPDTTITRRAEGILLWARKPAGSS